LKIIIFFFLQNIDFLQNIEYTYRIETYFPNVLYINTYYLKNFAFILEQDKEQFKIYEMESLFVHLANEVYKKRDDRDMKLIPVYAEHLFNSNYTYIFEKGFECHVSSFIYDTL